MRETAADMWGARVSEIGYRTRAAEAEESGQSGCERAGRRGAGPSGTRHWRDGQGRCWAARGVKGENGVRDGPCGPSAAKGVVGRAGLDRPGTQTGPGLVC